MMRHPDLAGFSALFALLGVGAAYFLVKGLREGRFARRLTYPIPKAWAGRERGYAYRDDDPITFWVEAAMQILAVLVSIVMIVTLALVP